MVNYLQAWKHFEKEGLFILVYLFLDGDNEAKVKLISLVNKSVVEPGIKLLSIIIWGILNNVRL